MGEGENLVEERRALKEKGKGKDGLLQRRNYEMVK